MCVSVCDSIHPDLAELVSVQQIQYILIKADQAQWYKVGIMVRVFANGPGDLGLIPGQVIPKTKKMVLDASLLNTQHYKVQIKGKVGQSW